MPDHDVSASQARGYAGGGTTWNIMPVARFTPLKTRLRRGVEKSFDAARGNARHVGRPRFIFMDGPQVHHPL